MDGVSYQRSDYSYGNNSNNKWKLIRIVACILVLLGVGAFVANYFFFQKKPAEVAVSITPTPTEFVFPSDTPTPVVATPTASPSAKPTVGAIDKMSGLNRADLLVDVQNGSGAVGVASKMADTLKNLGYTVGTIGNADAYTYQDVTVLVKSAKSKYLPLLKKDLSTSYTVASSSATLSASSPADAVVIVGK